MEVLDKGSQGFKTVATDHRNEVMKWWEKTVGWQQICCVWNLNFFKLQDLLLLYRFSTFNLQQIFFASWAPKKLTHNIKTHLEISALLFFEHFYDKDNNFNGSVILS